MERKHLSKGNSLPRNHRCRDKLEHRKKVTAQVVPTSWRQQKQGPVRIQKESNQVRDTHRLETTEAGINQDIERK